MSEHLKFAVELAKKAGRMIMEYREEQRLERIYTSRTHFRTVVDEAVDKFLSEKISRRFPEDSIYSEEGGGSLDNLDYSKGYDVSAHRFGWVNDAVDGTINL